MDYLEISIELPHNFALGKILTIIDDITRRGENIHFFRENKKMLTKTYNFS